MCRANATGYIPGLVVIMQLRIRVKAININLIVLLLIEPKRHSFIEINAYTYIHCTNQQNTVYFCDLYTGEEAT